MKKDFKQGNKQLKFLFNKEQSANFIDDTEASVEQPIAKKKLTLSARKRPMDISGNNEHNFWYKIMQNWRVFKFAAYGYLFLNLFLFFKVFFFF